MSTLLTVHLLATVVVGALLLATITVQACARTVKRVLRPTTRLLVHGRPAHVSLHR